VIREWAAFAEAVVDRADEAYRFGVMVVRVGALGQLVLRELALLAAPLLPNGKYP
jgi:hypothetical protein